MRQDTINVNIYPLEAVYTFPYLGRTITFKKIDWDALYQKPRKAQRRWVMVLGVLVKAGETV